MKTFKIDEKTTDLFRFMDPYDALDLTGLPGAFALAATVEKEDYDDPAAIVVVSSGEDHLVVEWMYTRPSYRGYGIGSNLLSLVFEEAKGRGIGDVTVRISEEFVSGGLLWDPEQFFINDIFKTEEDAFSEWHTSMEQMSKVLMEDAKLNEAAARDKKVHRLKDLSVGERSEAVVSLKKILAGSIPDNFEALVSVSDQELSFVLGEDGEYSAVLLTFSGNNARYPFFMASIDHEDEEKLARAALYRAEEAVAGIERIVIRCERKLTENLLEKLRIPASVYQVVTLTASTKEYDRRMEEIQ